MSDHSPNWHCQPDDPHHFGIEPVFMPVYKRRRKVNPSDVNARIDYTDETGDSFEEYIVYHPKFMEWMRINGIEVKQDYTQEEIDNLVRQSPYYKARPTMWTGSKKSGCRDVCKNGSTTPSP